MTVIIKAFHYKNKNQAKETLVLTKNIWATVDSEVPLPAYGWECVDVWVQEVATEKDADALIASVTKRLSDAQIAQGKQVKYINKSG